MIPRYRQDVMKLRFASMTVGLALSVSAAVVAACSAAAYIYSTHHFKTLLDLERTNALAQGELIRTALEHQMLSNDRTLLEQMIERFGKQARVEQLVLLDRSGVARYSSKPLERPDDFRPGSPTCQACHRDPPERRGSSRVIEASGGTILRTVVPIHNRQECYGCHNAQQRINGILILDYDAGELRAGMTKDLRLMVAGTGLLTFIIVAAIVIAIRILVMRRLQKLETSARLVSAGDLNRRVPADGSDTLAWLGREFNAMADSMSGLVGEVRTHRERLERVINSIDDGIVVLDPERKIIAANDAFLARARTSREEVLGCCCYQMNPGPCHLADCPTLECLQSGQNQARICERSNGTGTIAWEEIHTSPILDSSGNVTQVVEVWRDISERRAAEAKLADSHRLASLGILASGFSHELNTPLATVLTCVEGILREIPVGEDGKMKGQRIRENASIAREQLLRCRGITQHFLSLSRGQAHEETIVNLQNAISAAFRLVEPTARDRCVQIEVRPPSETVLVRAGDTGIQDLLINLLLNAVQASTPGSKVVLSAERTDMVHISVTDSGCGIAPEFRQKIFEPFFSMREGGTGLGLFLSLSAVRKWGGDISVESIPGKGSTFEVVLPVIEFQARGAPS
jgi:PAS domain S-box-containing protein